MELFQRLLQLVELLENNSQSQFAKRIGLSQQTFNNYLNFEGQQKIRKALLDKIITVYPQINRDWLYFDAGPMLRGESAPSLPQSDKDQLITELLLENRELRKRLERLPDNHDEGDKK